MGAMLSILMKLFPGKTGKIVAWTGMASGLGHMAGELHKKIAANFIIDILAY
jgi:hypothetical protein